MMYKTIIDIAEKLISVTDLSNGKAGKICTDISENNSEYIILKNNRPTAILLSLQEYRDVSERAEKYEQLMERMEEIRLLKLAETRAGSATIPFSQLLEEENMTIEEMGRLAESVEIE